MILLDVSSLESLVFLCGSIVVHIFCFPLNESTLARSSYLNPKIASIVPTKNMTYRPHQHGGELKQLNKLNRDFYKEDPGQAEQRDRESDLEGNPRTVGVSQ